MTIVYVSEAGQATALSNVIMIQPIVNGSKLLITETVGTQHIIKITDLIRVTNP